MFRFIKFYSRSLLSRKVLSAITIGGFAISMAVVLLLVIYVIEEKNVNRGFANTENIYRLKRGELATVPESLLENVPGKIPGVENLCMYSLKENLFQVDNTKQKANFLATNDAFFDIFSFEFIFRSSTPTLDVEDHIILTHSFCKKWYGNRNPVGEIFKGPFTDHKIVGVISDPPTNSSLNFDVVISLKRGFAHWVGNKEDKVTHRLFKSFIQLQENTDPEIVSGEVSKEINRWNQFENDKIIFQPFKQVYFDTTASDDLSHANVSMLYLLSSIAGIILFMTIFNYVNLTISTGYQRFKEIGIKKATGADQQNIFIQFLSEALLVTLISFVLALFTSAILSPIISEILGKNIEINYLFTKPEIWIITLTIFFVTGVLSGIFPAVIFSRLTPLQMMAHKKLKIKKAGNGNIIAAQFVITITLFASVLFIEKQIDFIKHKDLGFDQEMIVRVKLEGRAWRKSNVLKESLLANSGIVAVSGSSGSMMNFTGRGSEEVEINDEIKKVDFRMFGIDDNFIDLFGLEIIKGRNIDYESQSHTCLINERYYKHLGWEDIEGQKLRGQFEVVGVVKDFHFDKLHKDIGFLVMEKSYQADVVNIKISGNISESLKYIKKCYSETEPLIAFDYSFYDDWIQNMYDKEEKQARAIKIFALFAIIISCLGLIGVIELITNNKIKEIGIRKVNGAKVSEILSLLNKDFIKWVAIAFVIAVPLAYFAMQKWLENFAYKTTLSWWIFALAGILALGIALLTVSWQSWRAATRNPIEALRYE